MATEIVRANSYTQTGFGQLLNPTYAYDGNDSTYANASVRGDPADMYTVINTASFGVKTKTWTSYRFMLRYKNLITIPNGRTGGSVLVAYSINGSTYTDALDADMEMDDDYSSVPLEIPLSGNPTMSNLKIKITVNSFSGDGVNGSTCNNYAYELWVEGTYSDPSPNFLLSFV